MRRERPRTPPPQHTPEPSKTTEGRPTFEAIYGAHARWVWSTLRHLGVPERSLADAMQEVFMVVWRRLPEYEPRSRVRGWLAAIAARVAAKLRSSDARGAPAMEDIDEQRRPDTEAVLDPVDAAQALASADELQRVLDDMDPDLRIYLLSFHRDEVPISEIAEHMGIPEGTVKTRLRLARVAFKAAWDRHEARERHAEAARKGTKGANVLALFGPLELLKADGEGPLLPDGVYERVRAGIQRARSGDGGGSEGGDRGRRGRSPPDAGPVSTVAGALSRKVAVTVGTLVALVTAGAFVAGVLVGLAWPRPHAPSDPVPSPPERAATAPEPMAPTPATAALSPAPPVAAPAAAASLALGAITAADLEKIWTQKAVAALAAGDPEAALAALQEHVTRFRGGGVRAEERDTLWISALLRAGRIQEARERFAGFEQLYPKSPRLAELRAVLAAGF